MGIIAELANMKSIEVPSAFASTFNYNVGGLGSLQDMESDFSKLQVRKITEVI